MDDKFYNMPVGKTPRFSKTNEYTYCEHKGQLINQGIRICDKKLPNNADVSYCGPNCPCYSPKTIISTIKTNSIE